MEPLYASNSKGDKCHESKIFSTLRVLSHTEEDNEYNQSVNRHNIHISSISSDEYHLKWAEGDILHNAFELVSVLGRGTFSQVLLANMIGPCSDDCKQVAIKIVRNNEKFRIHSFVEHNILMSLWLKTLHLDVADSLCEYYGSFQHHGHYCFVFPTYGHSLFELCRLNGYKPLLLQHIRPIARQMLEALAFLHKQQIVHGDIKRENIIFQSADYVLKDGYFPHLKDSCNCCRCRPTLYQDIKLKMASKKTNSTKNSPLKEYRMPVNTHVRLIDFGNVKYLQLPPDGIVQSLSYRAPEVLLGIGWDTGSDIWALACSLLECFSTDASFHFVCKTDIDCLQVMYKLLGPLPDSMLNAPLRHIDHASTLRHAQLEQKNSVYNANSIKSSFSTFDFDVFIQLKKACPHLHDLLMKMFVLNPQDRISASQALGHPYFVE
ncbi:MAG: putative serine/threonine-protein kinase [Sylvanvirus sp.]|uniref:Putative serine/threonine-protein kinase n=1 Tax=Sylvanvirus sp. TaxID=2487774 RepID=A0A3G5AH83_9VIRU|nr:MAG: putative serine/threonine-protein kinase [Sylvanvirus sp.]